MLGPIEQVSDPTLIASSDPTEAAQQQSEEPDKKKSKDDDSGVDPSLGLLNAGPVQKNSDVDQPVTSGGMNTTVEDPQTSN